MTKQCTHQNPPRRGLSRYEFSGPVLGLGHEPDFGHLPAAVSPSFATSSIRHLGLAGRLRTGRRRLAPAADERAHTPQEYDGDAHQTRDDAGQQEAPPLPVQKAQLLLRQARQVHGGDFGIRGHIHSCFTLVGSVALLRFIKSSCGNVRLKYDSPLTLNKAYIDQLLSF